MIVGIYPLVRILYTFFVAVIFGGSTNALLSFLL